MIMNIDRQDLQAMIKGTNIPYSKFNHPLVIKAGHSYNDSTGSNKWESLDELTDDELHDLYFFCKNTLI